MLKIILPYVNSKEILRGMWCQMTHSWATLSSAYAQPRVADDVRYLPPLQNAITTPTNVAISKAWTGQMSLIARLKTSFNRERNATLPVNLLLDHASFIIYDTTAFSEIRKFGKLQVGLSPPLALRSPPLF